MLVSVKDGPRNLPFKFGQNRAIISRDMAEFSVGGGGGVQSHFRV